MNLSKLCKTEIEVIKTIYGKILQRQQVYKVFDKILAYHELQNNIIKK